MPLNVRKYLGDTMGLTRDQHGAYLLLLMAYWMRGGPLPGNDNELAAIAKASTVEWRRLKPALVGFFDTSGGVWRQKRADEELARAVRLTEAKSAAGRKGAANKWQTNGKEDGKPHGTAMTDGERNACQTDAPLPLPKQKEINSSFVVGGGLRKGGRQIEMTPQNKLALFQKWLADTMGPDGWRIVGKAADPDCPEYSEALTFCKQFARDHGKGWPHQWPAPGQAA